MEWAVVILIGILSLYLLSGRGAMLIAGYNTSSDEEKLRYDEKKLCRAVGAYLGLITVMVAVRLLWDGRFPGTGEGLWIGGIILLTGLLLLYTNLGCRRSPQEVERLKRLRQELSQDTQSALRRKARKKSMTILLALILAGSGISSLVILFTGNVTLAMEEKALVCDADFVEGLTLSYSDIKETGYLTGDNLGTGDKRNGIDSFRLLAGRFENEELGKYYRYTYAGCEEYVFLDTVKGAVVVNLEDEAATREFYRSLQEKLGAAGAE